MDENFAATHYGLVLVTAPSQAEAEAIAHTLIFEKLAACVSIIPISSMYTWEDQVHHEQEWQLVIKTALKQYQAIEIRLREIHSYTVPEIIAIPLVAGSQPYLRWISEQVS